MKTKAFLILTAIVLAQSVAIYALYRSNRNKDQRIGDLHHLVDDAKRQATQYRNTAGDLFEKNEILLFENRDAKRLFETNELAWVKKFEAVKRNAKNLESAAKQNATVEFRVRVDTVKVPEVYIDSTMICFSLLDSTMYQDNFNHLWFSPAGELAGSIDASSESVVYWERRKFLGLKIGRKDYFSEVQYPNPWLKPRGHEVVKVRKR